MVYIVAEHNLSQISLGVATISSVNYYLIAEVQFQWTQSGTSWANISMCRCKNRSNN